MKRKLLTVFLALTLVLSLTFGLAACGEKTGGGVKITLSSTALSLNEGGNSGTLTATVSGSTEYVTWSISDASIATITPLNNTCIVKPVAQGTATLTAAIGDVKATCAVTVGAPAVVETVTIKQGETDVGNQTLTVEEGKTITLTATASMGSQITWTSSNEGVATVAGGVVTGVRAGTAEITALVTASIKATVTINVKAPAGTVYYDLSFGDGGNNVTEDGQPIADNTFFYWSARAEWQQQQVDVEYAYYRDGAVYVKYTSNWDPGYYHGFQLHYYNTDVVPENYYKFTAKINVDQNCKMSIAGNIVDLTAGDNNVTVYYKAASDPKFTIMTGYDTMDNTNGYFIQNVAFSVSDMTWTDDTNTRVQLQAPSFTYDETSKIINITDPNTEGVGRYALNFYDQSGTRITSVTVENGAAVDTSKIRPNGTYTVKLAAIAKNVHYIDSAESTSTASITVDNASVTYELQASGGDGANAAPGTWTYWHESWVEFTESTCTDDVVTVTFSNNAGNWYDTQFYYRAPSAEVGKTYKVTIKIDAPNAGRVTINGQVVSLQAGEHDYELAPITQKSDEATVQILLGVNPENNQQEIKEGTIKMSIVKIEETDASEVTPGPSEPRADFAFGGETDAIPNVGKMCYWNDQNWTGSNVTVSNATYADGAYNFT